MAHALLMHRAREAGLDLHVDSAAVSDEELGNPPDQRAVVELARHGIAMPAHRARRVGVQDFERFDLLVGMTRAHCGVLRRGAPPEYVGKVRLLLDAARGHAGRDVPDPWYGPREAFEESFRLIRAGVDALLAECMEHTEACGEANGAP